MRVLAIAALAALLPSQTVWGQFALEQTLPAGYLSVDGNQETSLPQGVTADSKWQWHYDSGNFATQGPVTICALFVRPSSPMQMLGAFDLPSFTVTMATALTDFSPGSHDPVFANNLAGDATLVHDGAWSGGPLGASVGGVGNWVEIPMTVPFTYDPSHGDFVIQVEKCGGGTTWCALLDGVGGPAGSVAGNRYGHPSDCAASSSVFQNDLFVPVVRIGYVRGAHQPVLPLPPTPYQVNQPGAGLTLAGQPDPGGYDPIMRMSLPGVAESIDLWSANGGAPYDLGLVFGAAPVAMAHVTPGLQVVNLDLAHPGLVFFEGGLTPDLTSTAFPAVPWHIPFVAPTPGVVSGQLLVLDPQIVDGFALSHAGSFTSQWCSASEDFESVMPSVGPGPCAGPYPVGWSGAGGTGQWRLWSGQTPSLGTGPLTGAHSGNNYMYCETSGANFPGVPFSMSTCMLDVVPGAAHSLSFRLSRIGPHVGVLNVLLNDGGWTSSLGLFSGPEPTGSDWVLEVMPFTPAGSNISFTFEYVSGPNFAGDLAIDDVSLQ